MNWKILSIILIVIVLLESLFIGWIFNIGNASIEQENECILNVCGEDKYTAYYYDDYDEACYCYEGDEITLTRYLG